VGTIRVNGSTSGYVELAAPAVAGSVVMTLPATTGTVAVQGEAYGRSATATVATAQGTTSGPYVDLATVGPSVTVTTGTKALVILTTVLSNTSAGSYSAMSFAVSGATTVAAAEQFSLYFQSATANNEMQGSWALIITGLTAGSNTFTAKYARITAGTANFTNRRITVIDLGS